ncbi:hypothetical protein VMCG_09901 [Cytospora schulzeri]|uniref:UmuC domain-containing protein n=1 Tax=Cytospora schulzeri TaxID=448051 RepID=A0A423VEB2_9PEZI|nr:hypothetical protein VMCG_09901 [Valsa malicola]
MAFPVKKKAAAPRRKQDRIILHFDYDCFYAQVVENAQPALKSLPLGIKQKGTLATCNYEARRRGVRKLQQVSEARRACPDLVLVDGEDLSAFRDVSKRLYGLLASYSWSSRVERLGLDEVFLDVSDIVEYNAALLNPNVLSDSFFCLSREDPEKGFCFDATCIAGCVAGSGHGEDSHDNLLYVRLLLASHFARYLRLKIEEQGYTSACGISTCKVLSKLVGTVNKPRNQTTLLSLREDEALAFMDSHSLRMVPGIGGKITHALESYFLGREADTKDTTTHGSASVTVGEFRARAEVSPQMLEKLLGNRPGSEKGIGDKIWGLLHGVDDTEVKVASSVPTQISIEDTYPGLNGGLSTLAEIEGELLKLAASLLRRIHIDLTEDEATMDGAQSPVDHVSKGRKWIARPKTLRLATRPKTSLSEGKPYNWARASRSQPLPTFVFHNIDDAVIVRRLVTEALLPMFHKLNPQRSQGWNIGMINICVANMTLTATEDAAGSGRDISQMFRRQDDVLREFTVYDTGDEAPPQVTEEGEQQGEEEDEADGTGVAPSVDNMDIDFGSSDAEAETWDGQDGSQACRRCGHCWPSFAVTAHERYHELEDP